MVSDHAGALGSSHEPSAQGPSADEDVVSPANNVNTDLEELQWSQKAIPSKSSATRRLPRCTDFPDAVDLEVVQPVTNHQIDFVVIMLQDNRTAERSLENLARKLQSQHPQNAYILIRKLAQAENVDVSADSHNDLDLVATSSILLRKVIYDSLIIKCGFGAEQIVVLGHGQGATAGLAAVSLWNNTEFAGVISIQGTVQRRKHRHFYSTACLKIIPPCRRVPTTFSFAPNRYERTYKNWQTLPSLKQYWNR